MQWFRRTFWAESNVQQTHLDAVRWTSGVIEATKNFYQ
jgi:hypothetical protein